LVTSTLEHPPLATPRLRAVRGAVTVTADSPAAIDAAVRTLLDELTEANAIESSDIVSAIFSATPDLHSRNAATAARSLGWTDVPLMCVAELETDGMLARCVRVLLHVSVADGRRLQPVYLGEAACLRPDLHAPGAVGLISATR